MTGTVFASTLQTLRKTRGVTQEQLAAYLGVSPQAVSKWENGSFPDGDLLPKIADYFQVTIDFLYGRDVEKQSLEQLIMENIKAVIPDSDRTYQKRFEQMMRNAWAAQLGFWVENKNYYDRTEPEGGEMLASLIMNQAGFSFFRLNKNLEYYMLMKQPEEGFAAYFHVTDRLTELFSFLGKEENLEVLFFLMSLHNGECVSCSTISRKLGISQRAAGEALDYLSRVNSGENNPMLRIISLLDENDNKEKVYSVNVQTATTFLILLAGADAFINSPNGYALSVVGHSMAWFEREKLCFRKGKGNSRKEEKENKEDDRSKNEKDK